MPPYPRCGRCCSPQNVEPTMVGSSTLSVPVSRFFGEMSVHEIASEKLNELSAQEKSEGFYDLHGVSIPPVEETPDFIAQKLQELDMEMEMVKDKQAIEMAMNINPDYVQSLRQRFLRAENYGVERAASRFAQNFAVRRDMFGENVLGRDVLLSDLSEEDQSLLHTGYMQVTKGRDKAGRSFCIQIIRHLGQEPPPESAARLFFFCMQYMGNQDYCQRKGILCCEYMVGTRIEQLVGTNRARIPLFLRVMASMPVRLNALHVCFDDARIRTLLYLATAVVERRLLCRLQTHFGTDMECMYSMLAFGIPQGTLPIRANGSLDTRDHMEWMDAISGDPYIGKQRGCGLDMQTHRALDLAPADEVAEQYLMDNIHLIAGLLDDDDGTPADDDPSPNDVLMGRGRRGMTWPGNLKLKKVVELRWNEYQKTNREGKIRITQAIYDDFISSGSRFLIPGKDHQPGGWIVMPRKDVCARISHLFRNLRAAERDVG